MKVEQLIRKESLRQQEDLCLIASENHMSEAVLRALGSPLANKYSEGYPGKRYYAGNRIVDEIEQRAIDLAKKLYGVEHVNVQPLSGAPANLAVYSALLAPGDTVLGMDLSHGGHLTHGHPVTLPARLYTFVRYKTTLEGKINYAEMEKLARKHKPKLILVGYSSYSRDIDYERVKSIADQVGALTLADVSHISGLIVTGLLNNPGSVFDIITTTTHKTLRGPRGGLILCKKTFSKQIDKAVFPGLQGGPHQNQIAALAIALEEASRPSFKTYAKQILTNTQILAKALVERNYELCFGGTENHLVLVDLRNKKISGREAQISLEKAGLIANMNIIPDDPAPATHPSGLRLGTPALTTRGFKEKQIFEIVELIDKVLSNSQNNIVIRQVQNQVRALAKTFPAPGELK
ncbi:serine hydroxymethyltransferase [Candidatus Berkelbacteria bacterium]|nr:serine hydroxymethyltransferase [Candidatus Berkelbacteria bacterium]